MLLESEIQLKESAIPLMIGEFGNPAPGIQNPYSLLKHGAKLIKVALSAGILSKEGKTRP